MSTVDVEQVAEALQSIATELKYSGVSDNVAEMTRSLDRVAEAIRTDLSDALREGLLAIAAALRDKTVTKP